MTTEPSAVNEQGIRADERRTVCAEEGHLDTTTLGSIDREIRCARCGATWTTPREAADL